MSVFTLFPPTILFDTRNKYKDVDSETAVQDYWSRIKDHEKHYEPVVETNWPFIRIINVRFLLLK